MRIQPIGKTAWRRFGVAGGLALAVLSGPVMAGEPLEQRVERYWTARSSNDLHTIYNLESAASPRGWLTPDQSSKLGGLPVRQVRIVSVKIDGDTAKVTLEGQVAVGTLGWTVQTLTEKWVLVNDEWYHQTQLAPPAEKPEPAAAQPAPAQPAPAQPAPAPKP